MKDTELLIQQVQKGDLNAFSSLIDQHKNLVYSLVLRMVKNSQDAEELAQDTFVKAFKSIKQFKGDSKFSTWIYKIAYFTSINHLRKNKLLSSSIELSTIESQDSSVLEELDKEDQQQYLNKALSYLKPIDRTLISLFYLEELSIKEIEEITLFSQANIKVKLLRIRKQLNGILQKLLKHETQGILKS
ncbi:MAG: sigma-70 family RNA polymerase sigma factor [Flavobacteriales bacterium]|nr:sigma-70 family RNA polymerase sigma factor [Flavobacteriales bacterium]